MKPRCYLKVLNPIVFGLALGVAGLVAQSPAPKADVPGPDPATKPSGDPFVKAKPAAPAKPIALRSNYWSQHVVIVLETYKMHQETLHALQEEGLAAQAFFDRVLQLASTGKAQLESLIVVPTRSGQRITSMGVDELIYPTEFEPATPTRPFPFPISYEMRPLGEQLEVDPVVSPDGKFLDANCVFELTRLAGFTAAKADPSADGELLPAIVSRKITTVVTCHLDTPTFLGTMNAPKGSGVAGADGDGSVSAVFIRYRHSSPVSAEPEDDAREEAGRSKNMRMTFRFHSLPRAKAHEFLAETVDSDRLLQLTTSLPKEEARLERLVTLVTRSGQRTLVTESGEWMYGTQISQPKFTDAAGNQLAVPALPDKRGAAMLPAGFSHFEVRPTGWRIEVDPVLSHRGTVADVSLAPELVEYRGVTQGHPLLERYPQQPLFGTQKFMTSISATVGHQCFLGTISRPRDTGANGRQDDGRTWFAFLKVTVE